MGRVLGVDPGEARVGVAVSDELGVLASPLETIFARKIPPAERIAELARAWKVEAVVVGVPRHMNGTYGSSARHALALIEAIKAQGIGPVHAWDERLSTAEAQRSLREAGRDSKQAKPVLDQAAACLILQSWLDARACG